MSTETALITGASSGIGLHLAHEFAAHGHPLVLVAPVESELEVVAFQLRKDHNVDVGVIASDLEQPEAAQNLFSELNEAGIKIDILVNNAGKGFRGDSWEIPLEHDLAMVRLNIEAPLKLTKFLLPAMIQRRAGRILNTASIAGFEPGPLLNVYHSTKAFLLSWSEALAIELENSGVTVTALCPGPTDTDFFPKADMMAVRGFHQGQLMPPQDVAKAGYEALMKGELFVVPGSMNKAMVAARRVLPVATQARLNQKFYEELPAEEQKRQRGDKEVAAAARE
jgi:short-subunit dehydrogenase